MNNKLKKTLIIVFLTSLIFTGSCEKDSILVCGVTSPQENIKWLKDMLLNIWAADFYKLNFNGQDYIIISDMDVFIDGIATVYNCDGIKLCDHGGENPGGHVCNIVDAKTFWNKFDNEKILLFKLREQKVILPN